MRADLSAFFLAKSLAVVGATTNSEKLGYQILKNIIEGGFRGRVYAVNKKGGAVLGMPCYRSLSELEDIPELIVIIVPAGSVPEVLEEAGQLGVKGAIIISGGFGEVGNDELEHELMTIAGKYSMRIQGPNCQGLVYSPNAMCASWPLVSTSGHIAVVAQSGTVGAELGIRAQREELGVSAIVSLGNKCDVNELDFISFFSQDANTHAIGLYLEGVSDGARFVDTIKNVTCTKPIVVLKAGRTSQGRSAVASHTKSLAGSGEVFEGLCKQFGVINTKNIGDFYDLLKGAAYINPPKGKNVAIVTSSGGSGALATDEISEAGLKLPRLSSDIEAGIKNILPKHCVTKNPIDLTGDATAEIYEETVQKAAEDKSIDTILVIFGDPFSGVGEAMCRVKNKISQALVICYLGGGDIQTEETNIMHKAGIPVFSEPKSAVKVIKHLTQYGEYLYKSLNSAGRDE